MKRQTAPVICSIGSIDPTTAAGLTMDLLVYAELGAAGVSVVAGVTAQNAERVLAVGAITPALVTRQLQAVWSQVRPDAVCIGLIPSAGAMAALERFLRRCRHRPPIVLDPVIGASSGKRFLKRREVAALGRLLSIATVVTPNLAEAAALTGIRVTSLAQAQEAARLLAARGCAALVTGGHLAGHACVDVLARPARDRNLSAAKADLVRGRKSPVTQAIELRRFTATRLSGTMRGAGGILAAALAVELGRGVALDDAVANARRFVRRAHRHARPLGSGRRQFLGL